MGSYWARNTPRPRDLPKSQNNWDLTTTPGNQQEGPRTRWWAQAQRQIELQTTIKLLLQISHVLLHSSNSFHWTTESHTICLFCHLFFFALSFLPTRRGYCIGASTTTKTTHNTTKTPVPGAKASLMCSTRTNYVKKAQIPADEAEVPNWREITRYSLT